MYNYLMSFLVENGETDIFRYGNPTRTFYHKVTGEEIPVSAIPSVPKEMIMAVYGEPPELTRICEVLGKYCEPEDLDHVRFIYNGINLNGAFQGLPEGYNRAPAVVRSPIKGYSPIQLQTAIAPLKINLPNL